MTDPKHPTDHDENTPHEPAADDTAVHNALSDQSAPSSEQAEQMLQDAAGGTKGDSKGGSKGGSRGGTSFDTMIGRLVIEQGLATPDEVKHALTISRTDEPEPGKSLTQILVDREYVTSRQLTRLREVIEAERSGQKISGYKILGKLGAGAMATVYKAKQLSLDRMVAIKKLPTRFIQNAQFIERFYAEGRAAAQLNHPNIVQAFDVGNEGDIYYFVMEYVEGRTVHDDILKHKRYAEPEALDVIIQVAEALDHAHGRGLIHRDVKPKNIIITHEDVVKLADMGLARALSDVEAAEAEKGKAFGTPYYISPEQIRGEMDVGPPADIYSLGATLYHMVTGSVPFEAKSPSEVMRKHLKAELIPPDHVNPKLSAGISEVIEMMMAKDRTKRYKNCADLLGDLRAVKGGEQPPIAHRDVLPAKELADLAAAAAAAPTTIPEDTSLPDVRTIKDMLVWPPFIIAILMLIFSLMLNLIMALK